jgi:hypothetical protein
MERGIKGGEVSKVAATIGSIIIPTQLGINFF